MASRLNETDDGLDDTLGAESTMGESEEDLTDLEIPDFNKVVLAPSDWTVDTLLSQIRQGNFDLNPDFQRRNAWTDVRKSKFIESLMLGLPIPQIVLAHQEDPETGDESYIVIDGKQRLLALEAFFDADEPLKLSGLTALKDLNGGTRADALENPLLSRYAKRVSNRTIRTVVIREWQKDSYLHLIFHRINHQTLPLSAQELRQALNPGPFTRFADQRAGESAPLNEVLGVTNPPDFRMRDVELLVRFLGFQQRIQEYRGNLKGFLDDTCKHFNRTWASLSESIEKSSDECEAAIDTTREIFGKNAFRRYTSEGYETRFNRAVFDVMCYYFAHPGIRIAALEHPGAVRAAFETLALDDERFSAYVTATTKTLTATVGRVELWGRSLAKAVDLEITVPHETPSRSIEFCTASA